MKNGLNSWLEKLSKAIFLTSQQNRTLAESTKVCIEVSPIGR